MKNSISVILVLLLTTFIANAQSNSIDESKYITIGGIEQWVTITGKNKTKPIVLFVHGGPGSVMSPFTSIYKTWEKDFIVVNWDQRGAGKTYGKSNPPQELSADYLHNNPLTLKQMVSDGIELTEHLKNEFKQEKVLLIGTSWGSILGTTMALERPDLFHCYIGHSQFIGYKKNLEESYKIAYVNALKKEDQKAIIKLQKLGTPPYDSAKSLGQLLRIIKGQERENAVPAPANWWKLNSKYNNEIDARNRYIGDDYSFIHFAGHKALDLKPMAADIDFEKDGLDFKVPVYLIQGEFDILTPSSLSIPYFNKITAPKKEYHLISGAAHGHNQLIVDKQYEIAMRLITIPMLTVSTN